MNTYPTTDFLIATTPDYFIVNKPPGILSTKGNSGKNDDLFNLLPDSIKQNVHVLSRLDRPVSGLMTLSNNSTFTKHYNQEQNHSKIEKRYFAIVEGQFPKGKQIWNQWHFHNKRVKKAFISDIEKPNYKPVLLQIQCIKVFERYTGLEIKLHSGRFHQIRSQLAHAGFPVKGDVKYGARRGEKNRQIYLFSQSISFKDRQGKLQEYNLEFPKNDNLWALLEKAWQEYGKL